MAEKKHALQDSFIWLFHSFDSAGIGGGRVLLCSRSKVEKKWSQKEICHRRSWGLVGDTEGQLSRADQRRAETLEGVCEGE